MQVQAATIAGRAQRDLARPAAPPPRRASNSHAAAPARRTPPAATPDGSDALGALLQRAVARRAQLARMPTVADRTEDKDLVGRYVERHSDEKRLAVDSVTRSGTAVTHLKLKLPGTDGKTDADFVLVAVTDPEYGWANDKASKRNWAKIQASQTATPTAAPTAAAAVPTTPDWLANAPPESDSTTIWTLPTSRIRYTQNSIASTFSKPTPGGARTLQQAVTLLKNGVDTLDKMPPLMIVPGGQQAVRSFDNRRLWVAKRAQKGHPRVRWASATERKTNDFKWTGDGKSIDVRR